VRALWFNGARGNPDAALVSAGAEMKWLNGFSLMPPSRANSQATPELCREKASRAIRGETEPIHPILGKPAPFHHDNAQPGPVNMR